MLFPIGNKYPLLFLFPTSIFTAINGCPCGISQRIKEVNHQRNKSLIVFLVIQKDKYFLSISKTEINSKLKFTCILSPSNSSDKSKAKNQI